MTILMPTILEAIRGFLNEYDCKDYLEAELPADGLKLPEGIMPDLYFRQTDEDGNINQGIVMIIEEGQQQSAETINKLRCVVNAWVEDEFDLLLISLPEINGETHVEKMESSNIFADYWILYEQGEGKEMSLTILYDENEDEIEIDDAT